MYNALSISLFSYIALSDYDAQKDGELSLKRGNLYAVFEKKAAFFRGYSVRTKEFGWFPADRVQPWDSK